MSSPFIFPSEAPSKPATIYDVAKVAGVSHQTVSRYLKGFEGIRPETRKRVELALKELNYRPNLTARSLATSRSHRIGALAYEMSEVGPSRIIQGASDGAREAGYLLDIVSLDPLDDDSISNAIRLLDQQDLAGIIARAPTDHLQQALLAVPFVVPLYLEAETDNEFSPIPESVSTLGMRLVMEHLVGLGHERILHLSGPHQWTAVRNRQFAYRNTLATNGLQPLPPIEGNWSAAAGYRGTMSAALEGITAIAADNDQIALGVLRALSVRGLRVPQDISVTGFDDTPESGFYPPPLTTVRQDLDQLGRSAVETLLSMIRGVQQREGSAETSVELVVRDSTGPRLRQS